MSFRDALYPRPIHGAFSRHRLKIKTDQQRASEKKELAQLKEDFGDYSDCHDSDCQDEDEVPPSRIYRKTRDGVSREVLSTDLGFSQEEVYEAAAIHNKAMRLVSQYCSKKLHVNFPDCDQESQCMPCFDRKGTYKKECHCLGRHLLGLGGVGPHAEFHVTLPEAGLVYKEYFPNYVLMCTLARLKLAIAKVGLKKPAPQRVASHRRAHPPGSTAVWVEEEPAPPLKRKRDPSTCKRDPGTGLYFPTPVEFQLKDDKNLTAVEDLLADEFDVKLGDKGALRFAARAVPEEDRLYLCDHALRFLCGYEKPVLDNRGGQLSEEYKAFEEHLNKLLKNLRSRYLHCQVMLAFYKFLKENNTGRAADLLAAMKPGEPVPPDVPFPDWKVIEKFLDPKAVPVLSQAGIRVGMSKAWDVVKGLVALGRVAFPIPGYNGCTDGTFGLRTHGHDSHLLTDSKDPVADSLPHKGEPMYFDLSGDKDSFDKVLAAIEGGKGRRDINAVNNNRNLTYYSTHHAEQGMKVYCDVLLGMDSDETDSVGQACHEALHEPFKKFVHASTGKDPDDFAITNDTGQLDSREEQRGRYRIHPQVGHTDHRGETVHLWHSHDHLAFIGFMGLEDQGMWIRLWPWYDGDFQGELEGLSADEATRHFHNDLFVFIPPMTLVLVPVTTLHAGALRTSFTGNKRLHFYCYAEYLKAPQDCESRRAVPMSPNIFKNCYEKVTVRWPSEPGEKKREKYFERTDFLAYPAQHEPGPNDKVKATEWSPWNSPAMQTFAEYLLLF